MKGDRKLFDIKGFFILMFELSRVDYLLFENVCVKTN